MCLTHFLLTHKFGSWCVMLILNQRYLLGRDYRSIQDFKRHVNVLAYIGMTAKQPTKVDRKPTFRNEKVHSIEVETSDSENESSADEEAVEVLATVLNRILDSRSKAKRTDRGDFKHRLRSEANRSPTNRHNKTPQWQTLQRATEPPSRPEVYCYGCGAPGVCKNDCAKCQAQSGGQTQQKNEKPLLNSATVQKHGQ